MQYIKVYISLKDRYTVWNDREPEKNVVLTLNFVEMTSTEINKSDMQKANKTKQKK